MFLIPSTYSSGKTEIHASDGHVPVCAVYSSIPVVSMKFHVIINGNSVTIASDYTYASEMGLYSISGHIIRQLVQYVKSCQIETVWDTIETSYDIIYVEGKIFMEI